MNNYSRQFLNKAKKKKKKNVFEHLPKTWKHSQLLALSKELEVQILFSSTLLDFTRINIDSFWDKMEIDHNNCWYQKQSALLRMEGQMA